jgi:ankyrin repeat protein
MMTMEIDEALNLAARAARDGNVAEVEHILHAVPQVVRACDADGYTLLGLACRAATGDLALPPVPSTPEQYAVIDCLLAAGADPSAASKDGWAPLHTAAMTGNVDLASRLLVAGASRDGQLLGARGGSPLALALFYGQTHVAELLAHPPVPNNLRTAAALGLPMDHFFDGDLLLPNASEGIDFYRPLSIFPTWERTGKRQELLDEALCWAARNNRCESLEVLVRHGASVNSNPYRGTPLLWAIYADRVDAATWLLDHGADPNLRHDFGGRNHGKGAVAMHLAAQYGCLKCLRLLLERGADPTIKDLAHEATPLQWAKHVGALEAAAILSGTS